MTDATPGSVSSNRNVMIVLSYLWLLALVPLLTEKDDKEVQWHAKHGLVLMVENTRGSDPEVFEGMIREGGGEPRAVHPGTDIHGEPNGLYYQLSKWPGITGSRDWGSRIGSRRPTQTAGFREREFLPRP